MANDTPPVLSGERTNFPLEVYARAANGQFLPRLEMAHAMLRSINYNIQLNISNPDPTPVLEALRALPKQIRRQDLMTSYDSIINLYGHYLHLGDNDLLKRVLMLCAEETPKFEAGLREELGEIDPSKYTHHFERDKLQPVSDLCNAYFGLLTLNLHAMAVLYPDRSTGGDVITGHLNRAISILREKLRSTLRPNDRVSGSLLLEAFSNPDSDDFDRYLRYEARSDSFRGVQRLVYEAGFNDQYSATITFDKPRVAREYRQLADFLITLIARFEELLTAISNSRPCSGHGSGSSTPDLVTSNMNDLALEDPKSPGS
ncbi:hypothetical protein FG879_11020 [Pseudomonas sp. 4B]|uniref:hypothetical protein n=1 Tax=Pseudomonas TaxID=286 RepID=UPI000A78C43F|nr:MULTISPECIES: hypothetical protein [Pseudomonas]MBG3983987.1 hypothetical protein [Pseudomonas aeruginosa]MBG5255287.1 hypothetical protein [Pseudomonas aeruginosa]MBG5392913.1 hypothetical protein [Pseudomonas aeruginosa]MBG6698215.1 hypothetical protein [Pseudomonas aeruginosa]MBG7215349.1 hypothetical protein [Pseudomonas aeruginosa]